MVTNAKESKKKKKSLMSLPGEYRKLVYQPNHITTAKYSYTLIQERIFTYIVFYLQTYVKKIMDGGIVSQLDLFTKEENRDYVDIIIPLHMISKPNQYDEVRARAIDMTQVPIAIEMKNRSGEKISRVQSLITHVDLPDKDESIQRRSGVLPLRMSKAVAMTMLNIERENSMPINYTSFLFDVALGAENKYTPRLYKLLSSWKKKKLYITKLEDLREYLQVGDKYPTYESFKRRILVPVLEELKEKADFYCELSETRVGKAVTKLNFIHKFPVDEDPELTECKLWNKIRYLLTKVWQVDGEGVAIVNKLEGKVSAIAVHDKLYEAFEWMHRPDVMRNPDKRITNPARYIVKILNREFSTD